MNGTIDSDNSQKKYLKAIATDITTGKQTSVVIGLVFFQRDKNIVYGILGNVKEMPDCVFYLSDEKKDFLVTLKKSIPCYWYFIMLLCPFLMVFHWDKFMDYVDYGSNDMPKTDIDINHLNAITNSTADNNILEVKRQNDNRCDTINFMRDNLSKKRLINFGLDEIMEFQKLFLKIEKGGELKGIGDRVQNQFHYSKGHILDKTKAGRARGI